MLCAKLWINAITTCEEAFYSWNSNPNLTARIDNLAKHFKNISTKTYTKSFAISKEDQDNLIGMTPINTTQNSLEIPSITIDLNIYIIQN